MKVNDIISEGIFDSLVAKSKQVFDYVANVIGKIGFGQSVEIDLGKYLNPQGLTEAGDEDKKDLTSMIGYYNEYCVAYKLAHELQNVGVNIRPDSDVQLQKYANAYKDRIISNIDSFAGKTPQQVEQQLNRVEEGSDIMARKLFSEISNDYDLKLIDVGIRLTGSSSKGSAKEDVKITIYKKSKKQTLETIKASLKLYNSGSAINMYNATFPAYLVTVLTDMPDAGTGEKSVQAFLEKYPQYRTALTDALNVTNQWKKIKKEKGREEANAFITQSRGYQKVRDVLFNQIFKDLYKTDKAGINERILEKIGLDGADEIYLLIGKTKKDMVAVSSRTSPEFKKLYAGLKAGFNISFTNPTESANCQMLIHDESNTELLAKFTLAFKEGTTFPHSLHATGIVSAEKKAQKELQNQPK